MFIPIEMVMRMGRMVMRMGRMVEPNIAYIYIFIPFFCDCFAFSYDGSNHKFVRPEHWLRQFCFQTFVFFSLVSYILKDHNSNSGNVFFFLKKTTCIWILFVQSLMSYLAIKYTILYLLWSALLFKHIHVKLIFF